MRRRLPPLAPTLPLVPNNKALRPKGLTPKRTCLLAHRPGQAVTHHRGRKSKAPRPRDHPPPINPSQIQRLAIKQIRRGTRCERVPSPSSSRKLRKQRRGRLQQTYSWLRPSAWSLRDSCAEQEAQCHSTDHVPEQLLGRNGFIRTGSLRHR